jgi:hypothetical protein
MAEPATDPNVNPNPEEPVVDQPPVDPAEPPEPVVDPNEPIVEDEPPVDEPPVEDEPKPVSRREQLRIDKLLEKYGDPDARQRPTPPTPSSGLNYEDELDADPETIKRLQDDRDAASRRSYNEGAARADSILFQTRLEVDAPRVESKYKFLDKNDEENFNPAVARALNNKYLQFVGYDPDTGNVQNAKVRYSDFIEAEIELAEELYNDRINTATTNIVKQAKQTGLRPDGASPRSAPNLNKAAVDMTDEELKAKIAQFFPAA